MLCFTSLLLPLSPFLSFSLFLGALRRCKVRLAALCSHLGAHILLVSALRIFNKIAKPQLQTAEQVQKRQRERTCKEMRYSLVQATLLMKLSKPQSQNAIFNCLNIYSSLAPHFHIFHTFSTFHISQAETFGTLSFAELFSYNFPHN